MSISRTFAPCGLALSCLLSLSAQAQHSSSTSSLRGEALAPARFKAPTLRQQLRDLGLRVHPYCLSQMRLDDPVPKAYLFGFEGFHTVPNAEIVRKTKLESDLLDTAQRMEKRGNPPSKEIYQHTWDLGAWAQREVGVENLDWFSFREHTHDSKVGLPVAMSCAETILKLRHYDSEGHAYTPRIMTVGFSNGGRAVVEFTGRLRKQKVDVDWAMTIDPIEKIQEIPVNIALNVVTLGLSGDPFIKRQKNVTRWVSVWQSQDGFYKGHPVPGADRSKKIVFPRGTKDPHFRMVGNAQVQQIFDEEIRNYFAATQTQ